MSTSAASPVPPTAVSRCPRRVQPKRRIRRSPTCGSTSPGHCGGSCRGPLRDRHEALQEFGEHRPRTRPGLGLLLHLFSSDGPSRCYPGGGGSPGRTEGPHAGSPGGGGGGGGGGADGGASKPPWPLLTAAGTGATNGEVNSVSGGGDHRRSSTVVLSSERLLRLRSSTKPTTAIPAETTRVGMARRARSFVAVWHSWTNCFQLARAVARVAGGSTPAPIEPGSTRASMAVSDPLPGPQVPPAAGAGSSDQSAVRATATPNRPTKTKISAAHDTSDRCFTGHHHPWPRW
jgi:hypothetical protein